MKNILRFMLCTICLIVLCIPMAACNPDNPEDESAEHPQETIQDNCIFESSSTGTEETTKDDYATEPSSTGSGVESAAFQGFVEGVTTREDVISAVGKCHDYDGSGFIYELYYTVDGYTIGILYGPNDVVVRIRTTP